MRFGVTEAIEILRGLFQEDPSDSDVLSRLATAHSARGEYQDALLCHRRLRHLAPDDPVLLNNYAATLLALGHWDEVVAAAESANAARPSTETAWNLGTALFRLSRWDEAVQAYRQALALDPSDIETRLDLTSTLTRAGRYEQAMETLGPVLRGSPGARALAILSNIHQKEGRLGEAIEAGRAAVRLDPTSRDAHVALGFAILYAGQPSEALAPFTEALQLDPDDSYAELGRGAAPSLLHQHGDALASFDRALVEDPGGLDAYPEVAPLLAESRRAAEGEPT